MRQAKKLEAAGDGKITFFSKTATVCPVCTASFYREELMTGRGRLIAGELTNELRRLYEFSAKFGEINPLVYVLTVCPKCYFAAFASDFAVKEQGILGNLESDTERRIESASKIFPRLDFSGSRRVLEGAASCYLALMSYDFLTKSYSPTIKQALCSIRGAWLLSDLHRKLPRENYAHLSRLFYRKAAFLYSLAVEKEQKGEEMIPNTFNLGPDTDKNYGYDGVLYLAGYLTFKYGPTANAEKREEYLRWSKKALARIVGIGKASKDKPTVILEKSRDLYEKINASMKNPDA